MVVLNVNIFQQNFANLTYKEFISSQYMNMKNILQVDRAVSVLHGLAKSWKNHKLYPHLSIEQCMFMASDDQDVQMN
jgi:hypothetical protein